MIAGFRPPQVPTREAVGWASALVGTRAVLPSGSLLDWHSGESPFQEALR
jgi:hypothetical protein